VLAGHGFGGAVLLQLFVDKRVTDLAPTDTSTVRTLKFVYTLL
jgi:hypothetical protein